MFFWKRNFFVIFFFVNFVFFQKRNFLFEKETFFLEKKKERKEIFFWENKFLFGKEIFSLEKFTEKMLDCCFFYSLTPWMAGLITALLSRLPIGRLNPKGSPTGSRRDILHILQEAFSIRIYHVCLQLPHLHSPR